MAEADEDVQFGHLNEFLNHTYNYVTGGQELDLERYEPYVDLLRDLFVPSLERRILFGLERFVYNEKFQSSGQFSSLRRCIGTATTWKRLLEEFCANHRDVNITDELIGLFAKSLNIRSVPDCFVDSIVLNNRLSKICRDLDSLGIERSCLGYLNVWNYMSEKDYWISSEYSNSLQQSTIPLPEGISFCSDLNVETGSRALESLSFRNRPRKRPASHSCKRNVKIERHTQSPDQSFTINNKLLALLQNNPNMFHILRTDNQPERASSPCDARTCSTYMTKHPKCNWKDAHLKLHVRKIHPADSKVKDTCRCTTYLSLPCRCNNLVAKILRMDQSLSNAISNLARRTFQSKLSNVCSCLNDLLGRLDGEMITRIYLLCEIRPNYLNFRIKPISRNGSKVCLFAARIATLRDPCKRVMRINSAEKGRKRKCTREDFCEDEKEIASLDLSAEGEKKSESEIYLGELILRASIEDVARKLDDGDEEHSVRSKIRDILDMMLVRNEDDFSTAGQCRESSVSCGRIRTELVPVHSCISMESNVTKVISFIESKIIGSKESMSSSLSNRSGKLEVMDDSKPIANAEGSSGSKLFVQTEGSVNLIESGSQNACTTSMCMDNRDMQAETDVNRSGMLINVKHSVNDNESLPSSSLEFQNTANKAPGSMKSSSFCSNRTKHSATDSVALTTSLMTFKSPSKHSANNLAALTTSLELQDTTNKAPDPVKSPNFVSSKPENDLSTLSASLEFRTKTDDPPDSTKCPDCSTANDLLSLTTSLEFQCKKSSSLTSSQPKVSANVSEDLTFGVPLRNRTKNCDNFTTMNKSMTPLSCREGSSESSESSQRIKHLIKTKLCKKLQDSDSDTSKTVLSNEKYYLSIPREKTSTTRSRNFATSSESVDVRLPRIRGESYDSRTFCRREEKRGDDGKQTEFYYSDMEDYTSAKQRQCGGSDDTSGTKFPDGTARKLSRERKEVKTNVSAKSIKIPCHRNCVVYKLYESPDKNCTEASIPLGHLSRTHPKTCESRFTSERSSEDSEANAERFVRNQKSRSFFSVGRINGFCDHNEREDNSKRMNANGEHNHVVERCCPMKACMLKTNNKENSVCNKNKMEALESKTHALCPRMFKQRKKSCRQQKKLRCRMTNEDSRDPKDNYRLNILEREHMSVKSNFDSVVVEGKYREQFAHVDKEFRSKLSQYMSLCRNVKKGMMKRLRPDDIYEASRTSIPCRSSSDQDDT